MIPPELVVPVIAVTVLVAAAIVFRDRRLGPHSDWVEVLRLCSLWALDPILERRFGGPGSAYQLNDDEYVATVDVNPEVVEERLWELGARRNLLAAAKTVSDGRREQGSWAYRGDPLPDTEQIHIMLFLNGDGGTDIYAHREHSSGVEWLWRNPDILYRHYRGVGYSPAEGEAFVRGLILPKIRG